MLLSRPKLASVIDQETTLVDQTYLEYKIGFNEGSKQTVNTRVNLRVDLFRHQSRLISIICLDPRN